MIVAGWPLTRSGLPDDVGVGAVAVLPDAVAEHHDPLGAFAIVGRGEVAAEQRRLAEQPERVGRDERPAGLLGEPAIVGDVEAREGEARQAVEDARLGAQVLKVRRTRGRRRCASVSEARSEPSM